MDQQFDIVTATPSDAQCFLDVMLACWRGTVPENSTAYRETAESLANALGGRGFGVLLRRDREWVGCGRYVVVPGPAGSPTDWVEIKRIGLLKQYRRGGLGRHVHDALEEHARDLRYGGAQLAVRSDQPRLVDYWRGLGYRAANDVRLTTENPLTPPPFYMRKPYTDD